MFTSLRSRLWLSYTLIILVVLLLAVVFMVIYLLRSPIAYRSTFLELEYARDLVSTRQPELARLAGADLENALVRYDSELGVRLVVVGKLRQVQADSRQGIAPAIQPPRRLQVLLPAVSLRDEAGRKWLYLKEVLPDGRILLFLIPRPPLPLLGILRNEVFKPFLYAGAFSLFLSMFVAFGLARWIGNPLQKLVTASRHIPETKILAMQGPREVQELTRAFNEMSTRLANTQKAQRDFVANVSHELKTPITSIQGFSQALQDGTAETEEARQQAVGFIQVEAGRMHRMVLDLLDLARIDSGILELQRTEVDLSALLRNLVERFGPLLRTSGVTIEQESGSLPEIIGDGDRLSQVFSNLMDNAVKFTPVGGKITLRTSSDDKHVQVDVMDTGIGIPPEALPFIFDRFYRADPARAGGRGHGSGLGLSIVEEIVAAHGGKITVQSALGTGSVFSVSLPKIPSPVGKADPQQRSLKSH